MSFSRRSLSAGILLAALVSAPGPGTCQIKASERATMSQVIDGTTVAMDFARPSRRGRSPVFGGVVHWGERWTPGANMATTFAVDRDVRLNGATVPQGTYSVWMDVVDEGPWQLILDPEPEIFHTFPPEDREGQIRLPVRPREGEAVLESLLWYFAEVRRGGGELRMHWGRTVVTLELEVEPTRAVTMASEAAEPFAGVYRMENFTPDGAAGAPGPTRMELGYDADRALLVGVADVPQAEDWQVAMIPTAAEGIFNLGFLLEGELAEVVTQLFFEFRVEDGSATGFELRDDSDALLARGVREGG